MKSLSNSEEKFICKECNKEFSNKVVLAKHINKEHDAKTYFIKYILDEHDYNGVCVVCGRETEFKSLVKGFKKTCSKKCQSIDNANYIKENGHCGSKSFWKEKGLSDEEIDNYMKSKSHFSTFYWEDKTDNPERAVSNIQSKNGKKYANKLKENPKKYENSFTTKIGYWIEKGYTESEAKEIISERQKTFSKEKCINKYGENLGLLVWEERQRKWQETMCSKSDKEIEEINQK